MSDENLLDIAHISFLEIIKVFQEQIGGSYAAGILTKSALATAGKFDKIDYPTWESFLEAMAELNCPIARIEGRAEHVGAGVFGLPKCPFAKSISNYKTVFKDMPKGYAEITGQFNREGNRMADEYRVGQGAGVSPFCAVHQPLRSAAANQIKVGGSPIIVYQLGCKAASGAKALSEKWIEQVGISKEQVEKVLDTNMCCYCIVVSE